MAKQANYSTILPEEQTELMQFRLPGLRLVYGSEDTFEIEAKPLRLDFVPVGEMLEKAGVDREEAMMYSERFYRMVQQGELARFLAQRMERVG